MTNARAYVSIIRIACSAVLSCIVIAGLALPANSAERATKNAKPNIVIIVADDMGYNDVSFNGGDISTPSIDRIADEGVRFSRFYANTVCSPTRAGLMTGRWPIQFGCMAAVMTPWRKRGLTITEDTFANLAERAGYARRGVIGKWHLGHYQKKYLPLSRGFNRFVGHYNGSIDYVSHVREKEIDWHDDWKHVPEAAYSTTLIADASVRFIEDAAKADEPFLLYVPFNAPHSPYQALEEDLAKFPKLQGNRKIYAAMVAAMDRATGNVLDALDKNKLTENTFVLFHSDNGGVPEIADNGKLRGGKGSMYEGGIRVCAAARWPAGGIQGGKEVTTGPVGYIDVYPTLKHVMGMTNEKAPNRLDGINLVPMMQGKTKAPKRDWYSYIDMWDKIESFSLISEPYKLVVRTSDILATDARQEAELELYDLRQKGESEEISAKHPKMVDEMFQKLQAFKRLQKNKMPAVSVDRAGFVAPKKWEIRE